MCADYVCDTRTRMCAYNTHKTISHKLNTVRSGVLINHNKRYQSRHLHNHFTKRSQNLHLFYYKLKGFPAPASTSIMLS